MACFFFVGPGITFPVWAHTLSKLKEFRKDLDTVFCYTNIRNIHTGHIKEVLRLTILQTKELKKYYGSGEATVRALDGVNFTVERGEFVAVVGTSGSGKSTLLHMLAACGLGPPPVL